MIWDLKKEWIKKVEQFFIIIATNKIKEMSDSDNERNLS